MNFNGFTAADFDAYLPKKWRSNVFNRERLQVKEKLEALGRSLAPQLLSADGSQLSSEVSVEHPALWNHHEVASQFLFFSRNADARSELDGIITRSRSIASLIEDPSPLRNHVFLGLKIDQHGVAVGLYLHRDAAVDRENLEQRCADYFEREKLLAAIQRLGAEYQVGLHGETLHVAQELADDDLVGCVQQLSQAENWFCLVRNVARDDDRLAAPSFETELGQWLEELLPVLHLTAWSRKNDHVSMRETLKEADQKRKRKGLSKDDRVRIVSGMLAGKTGVVQEASSKGEVKVLVGTLTLKIKSDALAKI